MTSVKVFVKEGCGRCPAAKDMALALLKDGYEVHEFDLGTADGMAEGAFFGVMSTPTMVVVDNHDNPLTYWRGEMPSPDEVRKTLTAG